MSVKFELNFESSFERLNLYLNVWSTAQCGDDIKAMTFYNEH